ncbi:MAG: hypothetical protein ACTSO7_14550 [Candidatus Heimdallarchaeota archaeon]
MFEMDYIPLLLDNFSSVIIIDNNLIRFHRYGIGFVHQYGSSFKLVFQLYSNAKTRKAFPKQLRTILEPKYMKSIANNIPDDCLIGEFDQWYIHCLKANLTFTDDSILPVLVNNFEIYHHSYGERTKLNVEVNLSADDAFLLFSNLCAINAVYSFNTTLHYNQRVSYNKQLLLKELEESYQYNKNSNLKFASLFYYNRLYGLHYIEYLLNKINQKEISLQEILRLNGASILAFLANNPIISKFAKDILNELVENQENLTIKQKAVYLAFLTQIKRNHFFRFVKPIDEKIRNSFEKIKDSIVKELANKNILIK